MATFNIVPDKATGDIFTEQMWDDYLKTNLNNLIVPPACRVYASGNQSIGNATFTAVTFNSERFDTDGMHSTSVNTARVTAATAGIYQITGHLVFASGSGTRNARIRLNGVTSIAEQETPVTTATRAVTVTCLYELAVGDYVELLAYQDSGGALNILGNGTVPNYGSELSAVWVGRTS